MKALRSTVLLPLSFSLFTLLTSSVYAQEDATIEAARQRFKEGVEFFDNREYEQARLAFVQAYALKPHPAVLLNLAQSELRSGHEAEAATHFARYLREHSDATDEQRAAAREGLEAAKESIGVVNLTLDQSGAEITVNGESVGRSPLADPLYLSPGEHTILAEKGGETARTTLTVTAGSQTSKDLKLGSGAPSGAVSGAPSGSEQAPTDTTDGSAEVQFDSADTDADRQPFVTWFEETPAAWAGAGLVVAGLTAGVIFDISARNYYNAADGVAGDIEREAENLNLPTKGICNAPWGQNPPPSWPAGEPWPYKPDPGFVEACDRYQDRTETGDKYRRLEYISFAAAGVFALGTVVYYFADAPPAADSTGKRARDRRTAQKPSVQVIPVVGPGQGSLLVSGSF